MYIYIYIYYCVVYYIYSFLPFSSFFWGSSCPSPTIDWTAATAVFSATALGLLGAATVFSW